MVAGPLAQPHPVELVDQIFGSGLDLQRRGALARVECKHVSHQRTHFGTQRVQTLQSLGHELVVDVLVDRHAHQLAALAATKQATARDHLKEHDAQSIDIGCGQHRLFGEAVGREVAHRAHEHAGAGHGVARHALGLRDPKVEQLHRTFS